MVNLAKAFYKEVKIVAMGNGERKYTLLLMSFLVLLIGYLLTAFWALLATQYTVFVGGVITLYGLYCGANVGSQFSPVAAAADKATALAVKEEEVVKPGKAKSGKD